MHDEQFLSTFSTSDEEPYDDPKLNTTGSGKKIFECQVIGLRSFMDKSQCPAANMSPGEWANLTAEKEQQDTLYYTRKAWKDFHRQMVIQPGSSVDITKLRKQLEAEKEKLTHYLEKLSKNEVGRSCDLFGC